jgi:hypothetical protein
MKELHGILSYIYLLQSSISYCAYKSPIVKDQIVYRGMPSRGSELAPLDESYIDRVIVWPSFTSTSLNRELVMETFVKSSEGILFESTLHPGAIATNISGYSVHPEESEVLIAAMSGFIVESVDYGSDRDEETIEGQHNTLDSRIPKVKLRSWLSWVDFDMEKQPVNVVI